MDNSTFIDEEGIPLIYQDDDYDNFRTPDSSRVDETLFTVPDTIEATSILRLRQKLKRDKIVSLYQYLSVTGDPGLSDLDQLTIKKNLKTGSIKLFFLDDDKHWKSLTNKRTGEFLAPKSLREKFGGLNKMKNVLGIDKAPSALEKPFRAATKLRDKLQTDLEMESILLEEL